MTDSFTNTPFRPHSSFLPRRSAGLKLLLVCALALIMAIPTLFVYGIVAERTAGQRMALHDVSQSVGGEQIVLGPILTLPYARTIGTGKNETVQHGIVTAFAETGTAHSNVTVEARKRGIYTVPVFTAETDFTAQFDPITLRAALPRGAEPIWTDAKLLIGISDAKGVRDAIDVTIDGQSLSVEPQSSASRSASRDYATLPETQLQLAGGSISELQTTEQPIIVKAKLIVGGAQRLAFAPYAKTTEIKLTSNWADPSFTGAILPLQHTAGKTDAGFEAEWRVPYIARGVPGAAANLSLYDVSGYGVRDMAVRFIEAHSPYQSVERALKYAAMFIGFVFLAYFLLELSSEARAHPAQYVLVGLAQVIFYVLLLAFSERFGFDIAFAVAASMTVVLTAFYAGTVFKARIYGLRALAILSGIYGLIYVLMRAEGAALLAGALASFAAIALTMYMTRNIDWYGDRSPAT